MKKVAFPIIFIVTIIASCAKKSSPSVSRGHERAINSAALFDSNCSRCHGSDGTNGRAPNLSKVTLAKPEIVKLVTQGEGRMPSFEDHLTTKEIEALADYVLAMKK